MGRNDERELLAAKFERHAEEEGKILEQYRVLSEHLGNGPLAFFTDLILTEEEMHHLVLHTTAKWLREPPARDQTPPGRDQILKLTRDLRKHENETIDACRQLRAQLPEDKADLLSVLLDTMVLDSEKHEKLLGVIEQLLQS